MPTVGIDNAIRDATAKHYVNAPGHANSLIHHLYGEVKALEYNREDDPLLYAYAIRDRIKRVAGLVIQITKWSDAVIDATPDQIDESGAQTCH